MIRWIKKIMWRRKLENRSTIVIEQRTNTHGYSSSNHSLRELRDTLKKGDVDSIVDVLTNELKQAGIRDDDVQEIIKSLDEQKIKVVIKKIGLLSEIERRENERNKCSASSPISR